MSNELRHKILFYLDDILYGAILISIFSLPLSESVKNISFGLSLFLWIVKIILNRGIKVKITPLGGLFLLFLCVSILSAINSPYTQRSLHGAWDVFRYTAFFFIVLNNFNTEDRIKTAVWVTVISIGIGDVFGILRYYKNYTPDNPYNFSILSLGDKNSTAQYLSMMLSLLFGLLLNLSMAKLQRGIVIFVTALTIISLVLTYARGIWVAFLLTLIIFGLLRRDWKIPVILGLLILAGLIGALTSKTFEEKIISFKNPLQVEQVLSRYKIWEGTLRIIKDHPFLGIGPRCFGLEENKKKYNLPQDATHGHNILLNVWAEMGTMGLLSLLLWLSYYIYNTIKLRPLGSSGLAHGLWFAAIGIFVTLIIGGMTHPILGGEGSTIFMTITALTISVKDIKI